jgi:hypothetical protein
MEWKRDETNNYIIRNPSCMGTWEGDNAQIKGLTTFSPIGDNSQLNSTND